MSKIKKAFKLGYEEALKDANRSEMTARETAILHPEFDSSETDAYLQGRIDSLMGDDWRYKNETHRPGIS